MLRLALPQRLLIPTDSTLTHTTHVYTPLISMESAAKLRVSAVTTVTPPGPTHMKEGVAARLLTTDAVQETDETCPHRPSLSGTPVNTSGGGKAKKGQIYNESILLNLYTGLGIYT